MVGTNKVVVNANAVVVNANAVVLNANAVVVNTNAVVDATTETSCPVVQMLMASVVAEGIDENQIETTMVVGSRVTVRHGFSTMNLHEPNKARPEAVGC